MAPKTSFRHDYQWKKYKTCVAATGRAYTPRYGSPRRLGVRWPYLKVRQFSDLIPPRFTYYLFFPIELQGIEVSHTEVGSIRCRNTKTLAPLAKLYQVYNYLFPSSLLPKRECSSNVTISPPSHNTGTRDGDDKVRFPYAVPAGAGTLSFSEFLIVCSQNASKCDAKLFKCKSKVVNGKTL